MSSKKHEVAQNDVKSTEVHEQNLSSTANGTDSSISSDLEKNVPAESPKAVEEPVENRPTGQDSLQSPANPLQPEATKDQPRDQEQGSAAKPIEAARSEQSSSREAAGPRTAQGKQRSSRNSLKHGLFFKEFLLQGEKRSEYLSLLNGLREHWQPQGILEFIEVENLAVTLWRSRRFFCAERATISENITFIVFRSIVKQYGETSDECGGASSEIGKILYNPLIIGEIKDKFVLVRSLLTTEGFTWDFALIEKLFGEDHKEDITKAFRALFQACAAEAMRAAKTGGGSNDTMLRTILIAAIDNQIESFTELEKRLLTMEVEKMKYKLSAAVIPSQAAMDLLMRYETHLSREIDRILTRLERLQRMRKGQPLPPQVDVKIS